MTYAKFVTKKERKDMNEKLIKEIIMIKHNQATREKRKRERSEEKIKNKLKTYQEVILNKTIEQENKIKELQENKEIIRNKYTNYHFYKKINLRINSGLQYFFMCFNKNDCVSVI